MIPILQHFNSVHQQGGMFYSDNTNQGPVEEVSRHGTATSGSGSDGAQDIIPGGDFDGPDLQQGNRQKNATSWREFVDPSDIMTLPQTPLQRSAFDSQGLQDSIGKGPYRNVSFSTPNHYSRAGGSDTAMVSIGERTKRMSMLSTPSTCLSTSSPTSTSMMQPSAFRLAGLPMTPDPSSSFSAGDQVANDETQPRPIHFTSLQPVMQFTPGPPMHMHIEHPGSAIPFADSFGGQSNAQFIPQASRAPLHQALMGLPLSTSTRSDLTATTCGFPSTPADPIRANLENSNSFPCSVKTESGDTITVFQNDTSQQQQQHEQQHSSGKQQTDLTGSPGRGGNSFDTRRYYHPYRLTQTEPISRIATMPVTSNYLPATPSVFTFTHPLPAMAHANSSPTPAQGGSVLEGTAQPTNMKSRHHHSGSLQSPIKSSTAVLGGNGSTALAPYMHSMSLPNQGKTGRHPVSPGGESLKSDVESEIDDDWAGTTAGSRAPLPLQIFGSQGQGSSNSPRLPKKHIWYVAASVFVSTRCSLVNRFLLAVFVEKLLIGRHP
ncbi:hypothetical protein QFC19_008774 [Naganishia cerealis]|uniref:Uncharacterized protein n=1 Tax=Naganishia cerealis TaxID=610337 RepID=A0ACC2V0U6_9TREE|nr:hypothetical protein QFC19_008774 [Naganishia cerealis]